MFSLITGIFCVLGCMVVLLLLGQLVVSDSPEFAGLLILIASGLGFYFLLPLP